MGEWEQLGRLFGNLEKKYKMKEEICDLALPIVQRIKDKETKRIEVLQNENSVLKLALKELCKQHKIDYKRFWKRIKPDKYRDFIARVLKSAG